MNEGTVKFFNTTKGFGFITPSDNDLDQSKLDELEAE